MKRVQGSHIGANTINTVLWVARFGLDFFFKGPKFQVGKEVEVDLGNMGGGKYDQML